MSLSKKPGADADPSKNTEHGTGSGVHEPHDEIGIRLRALYSEIESQPIPKDLIALLERLDEAEKGGGGGEPA